MNEVNRKKIEKTERTDKNARWHELVAKAEARKAAYLSKFEGRTPVEKYRLAQERTKAARTEKPKNGVG